MEIKPTTKEELYKQARTIKESELGLKLPYDSSNYRKDTLKILKGLYCIINNVPKCKEEDIDFSPDVVNNCVYLALMTMDPSFLTKIRTKHPEKITNNEKLEYIRRLLNQMSMLHADASEEYLREYYSIYIDPPKDIEIMLQSYDEEWKETFDEWLTNIAVEIEDEEIEKKEIARIVQKVKESTKRYFEHNPNANLPFPSHFCKSGEDENMLYKISYLKNNPQLWNFDLRERMRLLELLEKELDSAVQKWYEKVDDIIERKIIDDDYYYLN